MAIRHHFAFGCVLAVIGIHPSRAIEISTLLNIELEEGYSKEVKAFLPKREYCQNALDVVSLNSTIDPDIKNDRRGCAGTVCFTTDGKYAIKRSFGLPKKNKNQLDRLNTATNVIKSLKRPGFEMNLPIHMFRIKSPTGKLEMCNMQIYPKVNSALTLGEYLHVYRENRDPKSLDVIELCGKNLATLQSNVIISKNKYDTGPHHGDFHKGNILVTFPKKNTPKLTVIDIESFHDHGRLIHDPVYFIYTCSSIFIKPTIPINESFNMMDPVVKRFYMGYVMHLQVNALKRMHSIFNASDISTEGPLACAMGYGYQSAALKSPYLEPMQIKYFNEAYKARFSKKLKTVTPPVDSDYHLLNLEKHENLDLSFSEETKTLDFLEMLPNIRKLNLRYAPVQNFDPLQFLTKVEEINLANTTIDDIHPLENLTTLKKLDISNTSIKHEDVEVLLKKLPNCEIIVG